jgi:AmmeMemoRadiSam system protein B
MTSLDRPKLRWLRGRRIDYQGQSYVAFEDPLQVADVSTLVLMDVAEYVLCHFDGQTSLPEIQARVLRATGQMIALENLEALVGQLDRALILDGPSFAAFRSSYAQERVRPAALAGNSYAGTEKALRAQLSQFFAHANGSGPADGGIAADAARPALRGVLSPHIDFHRGGPVYTWSYKELVERSDADLFVILGVAHQPCHRRFALTRKDFETPLGLARTDRSYIDKLAALAGDQFFDDELAHRTEHSIEFQVVFLQYLLEGRRDFSIVPILVGSFHDLMERGVEPIADTEVRRFVEALRAAESASGKTVAYIGGIDLGHVGPEFGDPQLLDSGTLEQLRVFDSAMLDHAADGDAASWFARASLVNNRWRICGLAATYTMLHAMGPSRGKLLRYDQAVNPERTCCVSFASLVFEAHHHPDVRPTASAPGS